MISIFIILSVTLYNLAVLIIGFLIFRIGIKYLRSYHDRTMDIEIRSKWIPIFKSQQLPIGIFIALLGAGIIIYSIFKDKSFTYKESESTKVLKASYFQPKNFYTGADVLPPLSPICVCPLTETPPAITSSVTVTLP